MDASADSNSGLRQASEVRLLEPGKPIEREIAGGQSHSYCLTLAAGQSLYVVTEQRGIDLIVTAFAPDGKKLVELDSANGAQGPEPVRLVTAAAGKYRLEVRSTDKRVAAGRYEVRIEESRNATPQDELRVAAQMAFAEGMQLLADRATLLMADGQQIWGVDNLRPNSKNITGISLNTVMFKPGDYLLILEGLTSQGRYVPAAKYPFRAVEQ